MSDKDKMDAALDRIFAYGASKKDATEQNPELKPQEPIGLRRFVSKKRAAGRSHNEQD